METEREKFYSEEDSSGKISSILSTLNKVERRQYLDQIERGRLHAEFGEAIGNEIWQYQGGLRYLGNATPERRVKLMKESEDHLARRIDSALNSDNQEERLNGIRALIRIATINGIR